MKLPELTEAEIEEWLASPAIAHLGTINTDGSPRITALWYLPEDDGTMTLNTYEDNVHVRNIQRDGSVAVLVDSAEQPYKGVHYNGHATVLEEATSPEEIARLYERYLGGRDAAIAYGKQLVSGGKRVSIQFEPDRKHSFDFGKLGQG